MQTGSRQRLQDTDKRSVFTNYGPAVAFSAPGEPIYSTTLDGKYGYMRGTSHAVPVAAGVVARLWADQPALSQRQILQEAIRRSQQIDTKNPGYEGLLGRGRVSF